MSLPESTVVFDPMYKPGDTVVFDPSNLNPSFWSNLSEEDRVRFYGPLGYGRDEDKPLLFTFVCEHRPQTGHCVLINMETQEIETMRHMSNFRLVTDDEC
tara:strand:+ start:799 stop:1098 length:300 start_codon:yes stop_codon:yes gene_type:complete